MPQRGSTFELTLCGLRLSVLRSFVWVVAAAGVIAPTLASLPAAAAEPAEAPQLATTPRPTWAAVLSGRHDQILAAILVAAAVLMIAGSVLWVMRWWRAAPPSARPVRPGRAGEPTPLILARTAVRHRRPSGGRDQAAEEIGAPRLPDPATPRADAGGATRPSP